MYKQCKKVDDCTCRRRHLKGQPFQLRNKQNWGRKFIILLSQAALVPGSDT